MMKTKFTVLMKRREHTAATEKSDRAIVTGTSKHATLNLDVAWDDAADLEPGDEITITVRRPVPAKPKRKR
jgi:hypothetical protein